MGVGFLQARCTSYQPIVSFKTLNGTRSTNTNQFHGLIILYPQLGVVYLLTDRWTNAKTHSVDRYKWTMTFWFVKSEGFTFYNSEYVTHCVWASILKLMTNTRQHILRNLYIAGYLCLMWLCPCCMQLVANIIIIVWYLLIFSIENHVLLNCNCLWQCVQWLYIAYLSDWSA